MKPVRTEHHSPRRYEVRHVTRYTYTDDVTASYARACLSLRVTDSQQVLDKQISIDPSPDSFTEHLDLFGNHSHYFEVHTPHRELVVTKSALLDVEVPAPDLAALDALTVAEATEAGAVGDLALRIACLLPSTLVELAPAVRAYAADTLTPHAPLGQALAELVTRIHTDFAYEPGATTVRTTLPELLVLRAGVCQDFAHLLIGCLRSVGLPARYVSGYLETQPPPGQPRLLGADATHAWAAVQLPDGTWLDLDPTNDCVADSRYLVSAWGRDYRDVAPLKGVIFTEGRSSLDVSVDVVRLPERPTGDHQ